VIVGPEGGLTPEEVRALTDAGALVAGLGPRLLRTETAGAVAVALLQSRYGDLGRG
jgi:16S rRNA (uracil1498-N3)-methyltransferase